MAIAVANLKTSISASSADLNFFENQYSKENVNQSYYKVFSSYFRKTNSTYRIFNTIKIGCRWPILFAKELKLSSEAFDKFVSTNLFFKRACKALVLTKILSDIETFQSSYREYKNANEKNAVRKRDRLAKKVAEVASDCCIALQLGEIVGIYALSAPLGAVANLTSYLLLFFQGLLNIKIEGEEFISHRNLQNKEKENIQGNKRLSTIFHEIRNLDLFKLVKDITFVALMIFMVVQLAFSISLLSPKGFLLLSTATILMSYCAHTYQEARTYLSKGCE